MAQKNWETVLADELEGGVSTERAMTDIKRGIMLNLWHEAIGLSQSATPKYVSGINVFTGTGIVAFDKIKYLGWKDYRPIAEGKEVIVRAGEVLVIPPNIVHGAVAIEDTVDFDFFAPPRQDWLNQTDHYLRGK